MVPKSYSLLFILSLILVVSFAKETELSIVGNWRPIHNLKDREVVMAAKFAVMKYNKQVNRNLTFVAVVKGREQLVKGLNFQLVISAKDGVAAHPKNYSAFVWSGLWLKANKFILISFKEIKG